MKKKKLAIVIAIPVIVVIAIIYGFIPKAVPVDIARVARGPMRVTVDEEGKTRVKDRYVVSAPVSGFLRRITLEEGDRVRRGETVAELEPLRSAVLDPRSRVAAEAAVQAAEASLRAATENARAGQADADLARSSLNRTRKLFEKGYASKDAMDRAESDARRTAAALLSARESVKVAKFDLEKARTALRYSARGDSRTAVEIKAPVDGKVLKIEHKNEGVVDSGGALLDIGDPRRLEVKTEVLSSDAVKIKPGMPVLFERWGGGETLTGVVRTVEPGAFTKVSSLGVEEQRVLVIADFTSPPGMWSSLGDGYKVESHFIIWEGKDVLQVPASALFRKGEGWGVFAVKDGRAHERSVDVGHRNGLSAEIISGLSEGTEVIAHPDDAVRDGVRVKQR